MADVDAVLARLPTRAEREPVVGAGEGGDETTAIDKAAEEAILARIREAAGAIVSFLTTKHEMNSMEVWHA